MDFCERVGLGVTLWKYEAGNDASKKEVMDAASAYDRRVNVFVPCWPDQNGKMIGGVERADPPLAGCSFLQGLMEYKSKHIERLFVGQESSSGGGASGGMGNEAAAEFSRSTKGEITAEDAHRLESCFTGYDYAPGLINQMVRHTKWPDPSMAHVPLRLVYRVESTASDKKLSALRNLYDMGVTFKEEDALSAAGVTRPAKGEAAVENVELKAAAKQAEQQAAGGGMPGMPGAEPGGAPEEGGPEGQPPQLGSFLQELKDAGDKAKGGDPNATEDASEPEAYARRGEATHYAHDGPLERACQAFEDVSHIFEGDALALAVEGRNRGLAQAGNPYRIVEADGSWEIRREAASYERRGKPRSTRERFPKRRPRPSWSGRSFRRRIIAPRRPTPRTSAGGTAPAAFVTFLKALIRTRKKKARKSRRPSAARASTTRTAIEPTRNRRPPSSRSWPGCLTLPMKTSRRPSPNSRRCRPRRCVR